MPLPTHAVDCLIIGSGYGGSVVAARLASNRRVLVVEQGRRYQAGDFPDSLSRLARSYRSRNTPRGLWSMRLGRGTGNACVAGLGGASLVNYGITMRPEPEAFERWPLSSHTLDPYFERAEAMLQPSPNPRAAALGDLDLLDQLKGPADRVERIQNAIDWQRCTDCGMCVPGCNEGAKQSLDKTYLKYAEARGAEFLLETQALDCKPIPGGYRVTVEDLGRRSRSAIDAREVVLAGGTFGSLDFLYRNRHQLPLSKRFGQGMSMNGDSLAFLYNTPIAINSHHGAPISAALRVPFQDRLRGRRSLLVMSGRLPFWVRRPSALLLSMWAGTALPGPPSRRRPRHTETTPSERAWRRLRDLLGPGPDGALAHSLMYKLDAQDDAAGKVSFNDRGEAAIDWPDYHAQPILRFAGRLLERWADRIGGTIVRDIGSWPGMRSFGVHPLGGCAMGTDVESGVVDPLGRLFEADGSPLRGFRVVDASIIPDAIGVPPSLTIAAVAERIAEHMLRNPT